VGIGAQRAGTTWWHALMTEHPRVFGPPVKELHFLGRRALEREEGVADEYARYFPRPSGAVAGEWTPSYLQNRHVPGQLRAIAPEARLLVLLRDPIDRYRSGAARARRAGRDRNALRRGLYATQLGRYLEQFPREQILVLQYERCRADPAPELARTFAFIGVDPSFSPKRFDVEGARSFGARDVLPEDLRRRLLRRYEPEVLALADLGIELDLSLWPNFTHLAR
jgi:Sulfotransferase domain